MVDARDAVKAILVSEKWKSALEHKENKVNEAGYVDTPLRKIIREMPDLAIIVFDRSVEIKNRIMDITHDDFECTYHLDLIEDTFANWSETHEECRKSSDEDYKLNTEEKNRENTDENDIQVNEKKPGDSYNKYRSIIEENHILSIIVKYQRKELMRHNVVRALLHHKWLKVGLPIFLLNVVLYSLFLYSLTVYMVTSIPPYMLNYNE
ncbi:hypothetical protein Ciccas_000043 [Cichlidogyrus casuarinus]|uniref:Uncharacterized protein n=1 Tax=Cichlidogyrus casuarinus TaxID=1844966 RepID=A0ABD2QP28_9PLAT